MLNSISYQALGFFVRVQQILLKRTVNLEYISDHFVSFSERHAAKASAEGISDKEMTHLALSLVKQEGKDAEHMASER